MHNHLERSNKSMRRALRRFAGGRKFDTTGSVAVEFAIVAATIILMAIAVADLGMGFYRGMQVRNAAQAGAAYAMAKGFSANSISSAIVNATSFSGISASPAPTQFCGCASASGITTASCGSSCGGGVTAGTYVT